MGHRAKDQTTPSISVPKWLVKAIKEQAEREHRSASGYIAWRMEQYLVREHPAEYSGKVHAVINGSHNHVQLADHDHKKH